MLDLFFNFSSCFISASDFVLLLKTFELLLFYGFDTSSLFVSKGLDLLESSSIVVFWPY